MKRTLFALAIVLVAGVRPLHIDAQQAPAPAPRVPDPGSPIPSSVQPVLDQYCVTCHNERLKTGGRMARKMPSANVIGDRPAVSFTSSVAPWSARI